MSQGAQGQKVWFVTGASSGFGRELVDEVLRHGDRVVAAVRTPESLADLARREDVLVVRLDVTKPATSTPAPARRSTDSGASTGSSIARGLASSARSRRRAKRRYARRWRRCSSARSRSPEPSCRSCASAAAARSSRSPAWAVSRQRRASERTARPSTRSRASPSAWPRNSPPSACGSSSSSRARSARRSSAPASAACRRSTPMRLPSDRRGPSHPRTTACSRAIRRSWLRRSRTQ